MLTQLHTRPVFQRLLFASCFEDPELDRAALRIAPEHTVLCITSGGCNVLSLLLDQPRRLIALDMNAAQSALLELKIEGIRRLPHGQYLELLGIRPSRRRLDLYRRLPAIRFWDEHPEMIERGLLNQGRFERYLGLFRRLLVLIQGQRRMRALVQPRSRNEREAFYEDVWNTPLWRACFRIFFSRTVLGRLGLDPMFFDFVEPGESFGETFLKRARHALVDLPVHENYFVDQVLFGTYRLAVPPYLQGENFAKLKGLVDRVEIVTCNLESYLATLPGGTLDRINFSNVFEWMPPDACERLLREVIRVSKPGARMSYRNLLVRRERPESLARWIQSDPMAQDLQSRDRAFVYGNFVVESIVKEENTCDFSHAPAFSYTCSH